MAYDFSDLIIFEMANNHQGSVAHGIRIVEAMAKIAREYRIRAAVKLQYRDLDSFIHPSFVGSKDNKHIQRFLSTRLPPEDMQALVMCTKENGMLSVVTPFDERSVEQCLNHGVDILKVASCSCMDWPLLEQIAKAGNPVVCSTGGCQLSDIDKIVTFFEHRMDTSELALLHCVGIYPTEDGDQQLSFMKRMMERYPHCAIGYSGHEAPDNLGVVRAVVGMGARILERHVGVPTDSFPLNKYSMNPDEVRRWVEEIIRTREMCGPSGVKERRVAPDEEASLRSLMRGVWARVPIKAGDVLSPEKVFFAMPLLAEQTSTKEYVKTLVASRDYEPNEALQERRPYDRIAVMRSVLHEAKGLLREARISIGTDYQLELSHHYGMDSFRRHGAIIVNFVNRQYCKKIIILLPGQDHPSHCHVSKEETFQVLYGDMLLVLDGEQRMMRPGDMQLVRRGQYHSFSSKNGCIFEEISTTHNKGDSLYADPRIASLDPVQRKTVVESW